MHLLLADGDLDTLMSSLQLLVYLSISWPMSFGLEIPNTYVNVDLLLGSQRNQDESTTVPPDPRSILCTCTRSAAQPDKVFRSGQRHFWRRTLPFHKMVVVCWSSPKWVHYWLSSPWPGWYCNTTRQISTFFLFRAWTKEWRTEPVHSIIRV